MKDEESPSFSVDLKGIGFGKCHLLERQGFWKVYPFGKVGLLER
jgi:hypothetical protein